MIEPIGIAPTDGHEVSPWKPEIPNKQRIEIAQQWLKFLGIEPTDDRGNKLKAHVMLHHPLSPKGQLANHLVLRGQVPLRYPHFATAP